MAQLIELASSSRSRRYLLARLSDTVALVDPGQADALAKALLAFGQTPKVVRSDRMSRCTETLPFVLATPGSGNYDLEVWNSDDLKTAARFWFGTTVANKLRKAELSRELGKVLKNPSRLREAVARLSDTERQLLAVCRLYGGTISGELLKAEGLARGLIKPPAHGSTPINEKKTIRFMTCLASYCSSGHTVSAAATATIPIPIVGLIRTWRCRLPCWTSSNRPRSWGGRRPGRWRHLPKGAGAAAHRRRWPWTCGRSHWPSVRVVPWRSTAVVPSAKPARIACGKLFPADDSDPLLPPAFESLYYELLRHGAVDVDTAWPWST